MSSQQHAAASSTDPLATLLVDRIRRSAPSHIVHLGGGDGTLLAIVLHELPAATGVLVDDRAKITASGPVLDAAGVTERVDVMAGGDDDPVPSGGDLYLLTDLPRSDRDHTSALLRRCHAAMATTARLLVCRPHRPVDRPETALVDLLERAGFAPIAVDVSDPAWEIADASPTSTSTS